MKEKKLVSIVLTAVLVLGLIAPSTDARAASKIKLSATKTTVVVTKTKQLYLKNGKKKITKGVKWKTNKKSIATVSKKGKITAKQVGNVTITATYKKKSYKCKVTVKAPQYTITQATATMKEGQTLQLNLKEGNKNVTKNVTWRSSDNNVAAVDTKGLVTAKAAGTATITATSFGKSYTCKVTVEGQNAKEEEDKPVIAAELKLSPSNLVLKKGEKRTLTATLSPSNVTDKTLNWTSSDKSVVSVDSQGNVEALKKGVANITVSNPASSLSATCRVDIQVDATVTSQAELVAALEEGVDELTLQVPEDGEFTIPSGTYNGAKLVITGNSGNVVNSGSFQDVVIAGNISYTENKNNNINLQSVATITVNSGATASILVTIPESEADSVIQINNSGTITKLDISSAANIRLEGETSTETPVNINIASEGVKLVTNHEATVVANAKAELTFTGETEKTTVTIDNESQMPDIKGSGFIEVTNNETGEKTVVTAAPSEEMGVLSLKGAVCVAGSSRPIKGATIELVAATDYAGENTPEEKIQTVESDENGDYVYSEIFGGNYYLTITKEGYKDAVQLLAAASRYNTEYINEKMEMISSDQADNQTASVSGTVKNAADKEPIEGITVELRMNKGNIIDDALETVTTGKNGAYNFTGLEAQQYTIRVKDERENDDNKYISQSVNVCVKPDTSEKKDIIMSKPIKGNGIRFVLTWGNEDSGAPEDLDSHLYGPSALGVYDYHHVYWRDKTYGAYGVVYSNLDVDEMEYSGPETMTIEKSLDGIYYYYVYNYSADWDSEEPDLTASSAKVDVYGGNELLTTYNIPTSGNGLWWKVCSYNGATGDIVSYNQIVDSVVIDGKNISDDVEAGMQYALTGVLCSTDEIDAYIYSPEDSDSYGYIEIYSENLWNEIVGKLQWKVADGFTAKYEEVEGDDSQVGELSVVKKGTDEVVEWYKVYLYHY